MPHLTLMKKRPYSQTVNRKSIHRWYNGARWRKRRDAYARDNPLCELCLAKDPPVTRAMREVHHKIPIDEYNPDEELIFAKWAQVHCQA